MSLQVLTVTNAVTDLAAEPDVGGDVVSVAVTATNASPAVFTAADDYIPTLGDRVKLGGDTVPTGFTRDTTYYVVAPSGRTFELSATSGGSAINSSSTGTNVLAIVSAKATQSAAVLIPFKANYSVVVYNGTAGSLVLQECDTAGGSYSTLATVGAKSYANVKLNKQFIKVSTAATLYVLGN